MQSNMENAAPAAAQNQPPAASQNESEIKVFAAAETQPVISAREYHLGIGVYVRSLMLNLSLYRSSWGTRGWFTAYSGRSPTSSSIADAAQQGVERKDVQLGQG
jgi:hypothetical protein